MVTGMTFYTSIAIKIEQMRTRFKGEYNWIKDDLQFEVTCPTGRVSPRENFEPCEVTSLRDV